MADLPIGAAIANVRAKRGLSQSQVGARAGFTRTYVSKIENDHARPQLEQFVRFAEAMDIEAWRLLRYVERLRKELEA